MSRKWQQMSIEHWLSYIAYFIAQKDHMVELEKLHGFECQFGSYENETACRNFVDSIAEYLLIKTLVNVCDGSTDISVTEQEVVYISHRDPVTLQMTLTFFNVVAPKDSKDAAGLKEAMKNSFKT